MKNKKTDAGTSALSQNYFAGGKNKGLDFLNYNYSARSGQCNCRKCGSDYMRFAVNNFCQDCIQRVEFIVREHPSIARDAGNLRQEARR